MVITVTVIGLGFVGLTTALGLAEYGHQVYGMEANPERMAMIQSGKLPFLEPGLDDALCRHLGKNFMPSEDWDTAIQKSDIIYYCVGTPCGQEGAADLTALLRAVDETLAAIQDEKFRVLVIKSTVPPSTTERRIQPYVAANAPKTARLCVANNPEFLREGYCWQDFMEADRIVIGCDDPLGREKLQALYQPFNAPVCCVSPTTGEFVKYLSNTLLATLISYSNEMAQAAEAIGGIQTAQAFRILHMDKRWEHGGMAAYAYPGCGYGGYCLPKDTCAFRAQARHCGFEPKILDAVIQTNEHRPEQIAAWISEGLTKEQGIGIAGLAFKPGSDDVRESPAAQIIRRLKELGFTRFLAYDPMAMTPFRRAYPDLELHCCASLDELCAQADCIAITTAWPEFEALRQWTRGKVMDCRYIL